MIIKRLLFACALLISCALNTCAEHLLGIDGEESTSVGILIKDLSTGDVLVDRNSQLALTPASVMKSITTASALSINGPDRCFTTRVLLRGSKGAQGVWNGDIIVVGAADPTLESSNFKSKLGFCDSIVASLKRRGISKVTGTVVVRQSLKDAGPILQWEIEDVAWPYGAGLYGFNYRDNTVTVYPNTGRIVPEAPGFSLDVKKVANGSDLVRGIGSDKLTVYTRDTKNKRWSVNTTVPDPSAVFKAQLKSKLAAAGISLGAKAIDAGEEKPLYTHRSMPFADIMRSLMVRSDNLFAEGMLRSIAPDASRKEAINREKELWATRGISTRYTIINDGSGLTRANRLSARFIADVLEWMARSEYADTYAGFFPRAGKEGTMRGFLAKTPLAGLVALKTGSVSTVQCYAGYKLSDDGEPTHVIVILVNGFFCPRREVREAAENLLLDTFKQ